MTANKKPIDLTNIAKNSDIPSVFYGATSFLVKQVDIYASKLMTRAILPGGTVVAMTINLIKDPDNKGKVIATTILTTGVMYTFAGAVVESVILGLVYSASGIAVGASSAPIAIFFTAVGIAVAATITASFIYDLIYTQLESFEEFTEELEIDIFSQDIRGKITQKEFLLNELTNNPTFCKKNFPLYDRYRQKVTIGISNEYGSTLTSYVMNDISINKAEVKIENLDKAQEIVKPLLANNEKVKKHGITIKTTDDDKEYTVMLGSTIDKIAKKHNISRKELLDNNEWIENENRIK